MTKRLISSLAVAAILAVSSSAFATSEVDPSHDGKHEKWVEPGNGPGNGYGHFKDHGNNGNDNPGGNNGGGNGGSGGNGGNGGQGGQGGAGGNASQLQGQAQGQLQAQGQQQGQGQAQQATGIGTGIGTGIAESKSIAGGGDAKATGGAASAAGGAAGDSKATASNGNVGNGNGAAVSVNASDNSRNLTVFLPPVPTTPVSFAPAGNVAQADLGCGPLVEVVKTPVVGLISGFFADEHVDLGFTFEIVPVLGADKFPVLYMEKEFVQPNGDRVIRRVGSRVVEQSAVLNVSAAKNLAIGGFGSSGGGNVGGGSSSAMTRLVTNVQVLPCELPSILIKAPAPVVVLPAEKGKVAPTKLLK